MRLLCLVLLLTAACTLTNANPASQPTAPVLTVTPDNPTQAPNPTATATIQTVPTFTPLPNCIPNPNWAYNYIVQAGDTLVNIAARAATTVNALTLGNCLTNPDSLIVGQVLRVPQAISTNPPPALQTYSNASLGIALDYGVGWDVQEFGNTITFQSPNGSAIIEILYGNAGEITPVEQAVSDCTSSNMCLGNRNVLNEEALTLPSGFPGIRLAFSADVVDGDPGPSLMFFVVMSNRNFYIRGFGDLTQFDPFIRTLRPLMF